MKRIRTDNIQNTVKQVKQPQIQEVEKEPVINYSAGSTLFNLAAYDNVKYGLKGGKIVNIIGDESAGKSFVAFTILADAVHDNKFKNHVFIYDDAEHANSFNIGKLFGKQTLEKIIFNQSNTIEDFDINFDKACKLNKPFIYVLDSFDSLTAKEDLDKAEETRKAYEEGKEVKGSYGMAKPKFSSKFFSTKKAAISANDSLLVIVSQTRTNINPMSFQTKTRSGGRALDFYSSLIVWMAVKEKLKKTIKGNSYPVGIVTKSKISKNKFTGKLRDFCLTIKYDYGIDNIASNINYLTEHKIWEEKKGSIKASHFNFEGSCDKLIQFIEENNKEKELENIVYEVWSEIEQGLKNERKCKYE